MGMFDTVIVPCPKCGKQLEFQSKAGPCMLKRYNYKSVPPEIANSIDGDSETCSCGQFVALEYAGAPIRVCMSIVFDSEEYD